MILTPKDKQILKILLMPGHRGNHKGSPISNEAISSRVRMPLNEVQIRRKRLEENFLENFYTVNLSKIGLRRIDFLISTQRGATVDIAKKLLRIGEVSYVGRSIGQQTIDLRAEFVLKDNSQLLTYMEKIKAMDGVKDTIWSEIVHVVGRKGFIPPQVIESL